MNSKIIWTDHVPIKEGVRGNTINDLSISPDGTLLVAAVGNRVLLYNFLSGNLIESLKAHTLPVTSLSFCFDSSRFASGGSDNFVIIWKSNGQGIIKYTHAWPIQTISYSPNSNCLLSCSENDYGIWSPDQKNVSKEKLNSKILCSSWSFNGQLFGFGLENGHIIIKKVNGGEVIRMEKNSPVWCLKFLPSNNFSKQESIQSYKIDYEIIVGCWDKSLTIYKILGNEISIQTLKSINFYPCSISISGSFIANKLLYLVITGSNGKISVFSRDCIRLMDVSATNRWIHSSSAHAESDRIAIGTDDGKIEIYHMEIQIVHSLYKDKYAFRENLTEIVIQHLLQDRKVRIKCKDLIEKISVYKNKLAVQFFNRVNIYESSSENHDLHYKLKKDKIPYNIPCDLMLINSMGVLFCDKNLIQLFSFDGLRLRIWQLNSNINFAKILGGPEINESLILGLNSGSVLRVFMNNPFPIQIAKFGSAIISCDLSNKRDCFAYIDSKSDLKVVHIKTQKVLYVSENINYFVFNSEIEGAVSFSGDSGVFVISDINYDSSNSPDKVDALPINIGGICIAYNGNRLFSLFKGSITSIDVPQIQFMIKAIELNNFDFAYKLACLGTIENDWKLLAIKSLKSKQLNIAKKSFAKIRDIKYLNLISYIEEFHKSSSSTTINLNKEKRSRYTSESNNSTEKNKECLEPLWQAELLAYEGYFNEAARTYTRVDMYDEAIRLLVDLRRWEDAKMFSSNAGRADISELIHGQASWLQDIGDWKSSADLFISLGKYMQAAKVIIESSESGWQNKLIDLVRVIPKDVSDVLIYCADELCFANEDILAREVLLKLGDLSRLMTLYVKKSMWTDAAKLAEDFDGGFDRSIFLPYAEWLISQDKFTDAMQAYRKADRKDLARKVITELTYNSVTQFHFKDASYYFWLLSKENEISSNNLIEFEQKADLYFAYSSIYSYISDPFTHLPKEMLFQVSRFIINSLGISDNIPLGISKAYTYYTLARMAMRLELYKLARHCYDRLRKLQLTDKLLDEIEQEILIVQAKPVRDNPDYLPVCFRCGSTNPLLNPFTNKFAKGDICTNCGHPFVRSFINFEILPLVEFVPEPNIPDLDAIDMIRQSPNLLNRNSKSSTSKYSRDSEILIIDEETETYSENSEHFNRCLNITLEKQGTASSYIPVTVDIETLLNLKKSEIYVCRPLTKNKRATFYKNMLSDISIALSQPCYRFFHLEDFEFSYLSNDSCPYSRVKSIGDYGSL